MIEYASIFCNNISASSTYFKENQNQTLDYFLGDTFSSSNTQYNASNAVQWPHNLKYYSTH